MRKLLAPPLAMGDFGLVSETPKSAQSNSLASIRQRIETIINRLT